MNKKIGDCAVDRCVAKPFLGTPTRTGKKMAIATFLAENGLASYVPAFEADTVAHVDELIGTPVAELMADFGMKSRHARKLKRIVDARAATAMSSELAASGEGGAYEYQAMLDTLRFPLEEDFPHVILSYATATDGGRGELWVWKVACALREVGITTYNGKQNEPGGDWLQKFLGKLPEATVFIAFLSPEYFTSWACREEQTKRERLTGAYRLAPSSHRSLR